MELTAGNLSRPRSSGRGQHICAGCRESCDWAQPKLSARSESSSVEIVKTWLGFPYICEIFQICPRPLLVHAAQKIPTHSTRSILDA
jgi:hypothetical protein